MPTIKGITGLKEHLSKTDIKKGVIAVDGVTGCGKTTRVSPIIEHTLSNTAHLEIDKFIVKDLGRHKINNEKLKTSLSKLLPKKSYIILDSILVMDILGKINIIPSLWIYIKRMSDCGWVDQTELDQAFMEEYGIKRENTLAFQNREKHPGHFQIQEYHFNYTPHLIADLIVELYESKRNLAFK